MLDLVTHSDEATLTLPKTINPASLDSVAFIVGNLRPVPPTSTINQVLAVAPVPAVAPVLAVLASRPGNGGVIECKHDNAYDENPNHYCNQFFHYPAPLIWICAVRPWCNDSRLRAKSDIFCRLICPGASLE